MKRWLNRHSLLVAAVAGSGLWLGFICGMSAAEGQSFFNYFVRNSITLPGVQPDGGFVLGNFENGESLEAWQTKQSKVAISADHAKEGKSSAQIAFFGHVKVSQVSLKNYFTSRDALYDWSKYKALSFYLFNPQGETQRVLFQIVDRKGRIYKEDFYVPGNSGQTFLIPMEKISGEINVARINELSFFEWNTGNGLYFHLDEVKLTVS